MSLKTLADAKTIRIGAITYRVHKLHDDIDPLDVKCHKCLARGRTRVQVDLFQLGFVYDINVVLMECCNCGYHFGLRWAILQEVVE